MEMGFREGFEKNQPLEMAGFEQTPTTTIEKCTKFVCIMISVICFQASIVILDNGHVKYICNELKLF